VRTEAFADTHATADRKATSPGRIANAGKANAGKLSRWAKRTGRRTLLAEFLVCMAIAGLSMLGVGDRATAASHMARRASAICLLFAVLALVAGSGASAGRRKAANGLGLLVTLGYLASEKDAITAVGTYFANAKGGDKSSAGGEAAGGAAEEAPGGPL
jgi:hypothetical protein